MRKKQKEATKLEQNVERIGEELKPLREKLLQVQEEEKGFSENQRLLAEAETSLGHCRKERQSLERQMGEVLGEDITDEEIKQRSEGVDKETRSKERRLEELEDERKDHEEDMKKVEFKSQKHSAKIGQAVNEQEKNLEQVKERDRLVQKASRDLGIGDDQDDMLAAIKAESQKLNREMKTLMAEQKTNEDKLEVELDGLKARKTGLEERKRREQGDLVNAKKEIAQLKRQLNELAGASDQLEKIKKDWTEGEKKLKAARGKHDLEALQEEIAREKETVAELDEKERQLREEARGMEDKAAIMQKIEHLVEDIDSKKKKMQKVLNKRREIFSQLFGKFPQPMSLREEFQKKQEASEDTGRIKLSQEVGDKLGNVLKNMLGASKTPEPKLKSESVQLSPGGHNRFSKLKLNSPTAEGRERAATDPAFSTPIRPATQEDETLYRTPQSMISRRSRRGSQPSGSEVKQVNGFMLNP